MRVIRASEIGAFIYCQRAWWYAKRGVPSSNVSEMAGGVTIHNRHGRSLFLTGCLRTLASILLLAALALAAVYLANLFL